VARGDRGKGTRRDKRLTVEETRVFAVGAQLVLLVPFVIRLKQDRLLRPDQRDGNLEVEIGLVARLGSVIGRAVCAVDGAELGVCAAGDPTVVVSLR
jgi:hypothetical protein